MKTMRSAYDVHRSRRARLNRSRRARLKRSATTAIVLAGLLGALAALPAPAYAQSQKSLPIDADTITYHYMLDKYMMAGCITGATIGALTGVLSFAGISTYVVPYISFGCSTGFLAGAAIMEIKSFFSDPASGAPKD